ncbi:MAG: trypsin-like serine protease [Verrucomicrobiales bacterium]|jgi:hypothetical protein|nr:trypsin-like serine protease [Verrucomicrobiales bacterium]
MRAILVALALAVMFPLTVGAVVQINATGTTHDGTPSGTGMEDYVGMVNDATGVYLGNGWVITAAHVAQNGVNFKVGDTSYSVVANSTHWLNSTDGQSSADLALFQITGFEGAGVTLYSGDVSSLNYDNSTTLMMGYGSTTLSGTDRGFGWGYGCVVSNNYQTITDQDRTTDVYVSLSYNAVPAVGGAGLLENKAQAFIGDSGGAGFVKVGDEWQLAGIMLEVGSIPYGPSDEYSTDTAFTMLADLTQYADQINNIIIPEPSTWALLVTGAGLVLSLSAARRRK